MTEIINLFLEQTPLLIAAMKQSVKNKDWTTLNATVHNIIPSFSVVGLDTDYEKMARRIYNYSHIGGDEYVLSELISKLETVCEQACTELEAALQNFEN